MSNGLEGQMPLTATCPPLKMLAQFFSGIFIIHILHFLDVVSN